MRRLRRMHAGDPRDAAAKGRAGQGLLRPEAAPAPPPQGNCAAPGAACPGLAQIRAPGGAG